jgi:hypothetical protein
MVKKYVFLIGFLFLNSLNAMTNNITVEQTIGTEEDKQLFIDFHSKFFEQMHPSANVTKHCRTIFNNEKRLLEAGKALGIHVKLNGEPFLFISFTLLANNEIIAIRYYTSKKLSSIPFALPAIKNYLLKNYPDTKFLFVSPTNEQTQELDTFKKCGFSESDLKPEDFNQDDWTGLELPLQD